RFALPALVALFAVTASAAETEEAAAPTPVDVGAFGSDEPVERVDLPSRGIVVVKGSDMKHMPMQHWEQFDSKIITAKRWGRYQVRMTYTMKAATMAVQFKFGDQRLKKVLTASNTPLSTYLGAVSFAAAGDFAFALYTPASGVTAELAIQEIAFIPCSETDDAVVQAADGTITLPAKSATTWSEVMRYEPKPEKDCLGFWTSADDFAEWEFKATKPGRYTVVVTQGCGAGNGGSQVEVKLGDQKTSFSVQETGGFQDWKEVEAGTIEIPAAGTHRIVIDPVDKKSKAVMDVQKVVLKPAA
ncbi:MAG: hypothetical protein KDK97_20535, partial [Verrucomicrobiales bacterium]|nr:hypothetical protein [Verrucomicrobiales bacterium]